MMVIIWMICVTILFGLGKVIGMVTASDEASPEQISDRGTMLGVVFVVCGGTAAMYLS